MGREQKRKQQHKSNFKKANTEQLDTSIKWTTIVKLVCFVIILLFVIYYVIAVFVTKEINISNKNASNESNETTTTQTNSNRILASNIFNQKEDEYYVYFYNFNDENQVVSSTISTITDKVYKVDTSSSLNRNYVTEDKGNKKATSIEDLKVIDPTVIKIKDDKIVEYYEGSNEIYDELN